MCITEHLERCHHWSICPCIQTRFCPSDYYKQCMLPWLPWYLLYCTQSDNTLIIQKARWAECFSRLSECFYHGPGLLNQCSYLPRHRYRYLIEMPWCTVQNLAWMMGNLCESLFSLEISVSPYFSLEISVSPLSLITSLLQSKHPCVHCAKSRLNDGKLVWVLI